MISIMWLVFNGCPITKLQKTNSSSFTHDLLRYFKPDATEKFNDNLNTFILLTITIISFIRLKKSIN